MFSDTNFGIIVGESRVFHIAGDLNLPRLDGCHARMVEGYIKSVVDS